MQPIQQPPVARRPPEWEIFEARWANSLLLANDRLYTCIRGPWEVLEAKSSTLRYLVDQIIWDGIAGSPESAFTTIGNYIPTYASFPSGMVKSVTPAAFNQRDKYMLVPLREKAPDGRLRAYDLASGQTTPYLPEHMTKWHYYEGALEPNLSLLQVQPNKDGTPLEKASWLVYCQFPGYIQRLAYLLRHPVKDITILQTGVSGAGKSLLGYLVSKALGLNAVKVYSNTQSFFNGEAGRFTPVTKDLTEKFLVIGEEADKATWLPGQLNGLTAFEVDVEVKHINRYTAYRCGNLILHAGRDLDLTSDAQGVSERIPNIWHYPNALPLDSAFSEAVAQNPEVHQFISTLLLTLGSYDNDGTSDWTRQAALDWKDRNRDPIKRIFRSVLVEAPGAFTATEDIRKEIMEVSDEVPEKLFKGRGLGDKIRDAYPTAKSDQKRDPSRGNKMTRGWEGIMLKSKLNEKLNIDKLHQQEYEAVVSGD